MSDPIEIVVMGVQGTGKSTIGALLAEHYGVPFIDGDRLHPERNVALMAAGQPLTDDDRGPWLDRVAATLTEHGASGGVVVACSALKRAYRDRISASAPATRFVELYGSIELVTERIGNREHEYMPATLLQSQFDILEPLQPDEHGLRVGIEPEPQDIVAIVTAEIEKQVVS